MNEQFGAPDGLFSRKTCLKEFERLMERTERKAYHLAYRMTGNRDDAEDLTQEAYLRAFKAFSGYNRELPFESWFFRILSNLFVDLLRRRPKHKVMSLDQPVAADEGDDNLMLQIADDSANPESTLLEAAVDERIETALASLPAPFRAAVILCDVEGKTYDEIAVAMNCSVGTVRSRIHRGRVRLRRLLEPEGRAKSANTGRGAAPVGLPMAATA